MPSKKPKKPLYETVEELLFYSYANLAMAHSALDRGDEKYGRVNYIIRAKLNKGLRAGTMSVGSLLDDEKLKYGLPRVCSYCGADTKLTVDHLLPRSVGGPETADNAVWVCRSCNSSKRDTDFLVWWPAKHHSFPPLMLLRRYLKVAMVIVEQRSVGRVPVAEVEGLPFDINAIPIKYPPPHECVLWAVAGG